jgi:hypothetical protein
MFEWNSVWPAKFDSPSEMALRGRFPAQALDGESTMHFRALSCTRSSSSQKLLDRIYRLRALVFDRRLGWDVVVDNGREIDAFDDLDPTYIVVLTSAGDVAGCARAICEW